MKILKRKPSKICPCCGKRFFRKLQHLSAWKKQKYCSKGCGYHNTSDQSKINYLLSKTTTTESGCMEWQGGLDSSGYGQAGYKNKHTSCHRLIWKLIKGEIPKGMCVLHKCDNPKCINIDHLFLGTKKDNNHDKIKKGRHYSFSKLNPDKVNEIIISLKKGITQKELSMKFNVCFERISEIARTNGIYGKNNTKYKK